MIVYAVQYSNYEPAEIDTLWHDPEAAEKRVSELGGLPWCVTEWQVNE